MVDRTGTDQTVLQVTGTLSSRAACASMVGGTMANATPMTCANAGSQHCQQLHLRESSLVFWISTDRAGQSSEDGQVRKTSAGEYRECRSAIALCSAVLGLHREVPRGSHTVL